MIPNPGNRFFPTHLERRRGDRAQAMSRSAMTIYPRAIATGAAPGVFCPGVALRETIALQLSRLDGTMMRPVH